ncbi:glutamate-cysteine ligase family protein [Fluoribacter dumoffii]|uniref:glutamate-cysteine ligase family protein n=1 Tax=Fluoribacter dumoffii TaxID=463 RepID=UPI002244C5A6|nr:glutamate-cysteine ligase family protein [Fluoribacter dumoffii]MCW8418655.1 glutamate-cysteine ligase family protein [Fluoribacter dumoffii]MCW8453501.1 glutamate-cysteine ligase family protein [Fluoribacter dumoffii]MCW8459280.1 glutamate-cysteine ligase family protein [Fluoribacter dumoffii]MCW8482639.1 glutamate-cysteine ligase family protein [Fluoribacter dumoffii]
MKINKIENYQIDKELFKKYLVVETQLLEQWFSKDYFKFETLNAGAEIEFLILDSKYQLSPHNLFFTNKLKSQPVVREAGTAQLEINTPVFPLQDNFLSLLHRNVLSTWKECCNVARTTQHNLALIGSIPQADPAFFKLLNCTPENLFLLMNDVATQYRQGKPLSIHMKGKRDTLQFHPESLAMEGLICSLQLHLQVPPHQLTRYFNIIQLLSAPLLALSSNSSYFCGKNLWSETRIGIFEQLYTFPSPLKHTVFFEPHYFQDTLFPIFLNNIGFPYLLPLAAYEEPRNHMFHVRCQNSCIFRWNRPILAFNNENEPYLRIENRILSTGPTVVDMIANAAFFYGITYYLANNSPFPDTLVSNESLIKNFYAAARHGLDATLHWNNHQIQTNTLLKTLFPLAVKGLQDLGINSVDVHFYLDIIKTRLDKKQNGSIWQEKYLQKHNNDFDSLIEKYVKNQYSETPVGDWNY